MKSLSISLLRFAGFGPSLTFTWMKMVFLLSLICSHDSWAQAQGETEGISRFFFGSCIHQDGDQRVWSVIRKLSPQVCLLIGDNIYGDSSDPRVLERKYAQLGNQPEFRLLRKECQLLATWDDHDFGLNDAGSELPIKEESKTAFLNFLETPKDSPRRLHAGVYDSAIFGPAHQTVQVILLDTRTFRGPLISRKNSQYESGSEYLPNPDPAASLLGEEQWTWLEGELKKPARVRLLVSSIQVLPDETPKEKWANFPKERERLLDLLRRSRSQGVVLLSGDTHYGELSLDSDSIGYPLFELTSSGMNMGRSSWHRPVKNSHRLALTNLGSNFGMVQIDWKQSDPLISLEIYESSGGLLFRQPLPLGLLR